MRPFSSRNAFVVSCSMLFFSTQISQKAKKRRGLVVNRGRVMERTSNVNTTSIAALLRAVIKQSPQPIRILMILQCDNIRLSLRIIETCQGCTSHAATGFMRRSCCYCICTCTGSLFSRIDPFRWLRNAVGGCTQWLRDAWTRGGYGGWDAN